MGKWRELGRRREGRVNDKCNGAGVRRGGEWWDRGGGGLRQRHDAPRGRGWFGRGHAGLDWQGRAG
jgi:hypothetical protein